MSKLKVLRPNNDAVKKCFEGDANIRRRDALENLELSRQLTPTDRRACKDEARSDMFKKVKNEALGAIRLIKTSRKCRLKDWPCMANYLDQLKKFVNYHPYGWQPVYGGISDIEDTPRTSNLVFANFYTSEKFPWPKHLEKPMAPVLQIDLEMARKKFKQSRQTGSFPSIDGLLQVWERRWSDRADNEEYGLVRIIPRDELSLNLMTDERPTINPKDYFCTARAGYGSDKGYGAKIVSWKKIPLMFMRGGVHHSDHDCSPSSDAERCALEVECSDDLVGAITETMSGTAPTHLFGVSSVGYVNWDRYLQGWQNLFEFYADNFNYQIADTISARVSWNDKSFSFYLAT